MTIHKSKGLEFPVVIMPFAEEDYSRNLKINYGLMEEMDFGLPKVLVDNSSAVEGFGVEAKSVYDQKKQEELLDNVNVLYVARAEEQLYVISNMNLSRKCPKKIICVLFNYLMNKGVLMQINCIMSLEAQNYRIRQSMLILQKQFV
jgi:ATP-dependent exoDNAse (exonuclease V) beta subunit